MAEGFYYTAAADDCIMSIANRFGFLWKTIWNHPENTGLRKLRKEPNVLLEGDQVFIPELRTRDFSRGTEARHKFRRKGVPERVRFHFLEDGKPRSDVSYVLIVEGRSFKGRTDANGYLEALVPPGARSGTLVLGEGDDAEKYELQLGRMDPVSEMSGACMRLESLGFDCGEDKEKGFADALKSFQLWKGMEPTGELDNTTQQALLKAFEC